MVSASAYHTSESASAALSQYKVVIAYDFGTTFSGAAYAFTHVAPEVFDVQKWPHKAGHFFPKVPSLAMYRNAEPGRLVDWGHGAKKAMLKPHAAKESILLANFKLHLDEQLHSPEEPLANGRLPVDVIADYLRELHKHTLGEITKGFAKNYSPDTFRYCLTVPALWSDRAKHLMRQAAIRAGLITPQDHPDRLVLISEPEAAAIYCETLGDALQTDDRILVCDAGGGTVDIIVFQASERSQSRSIPQQLKQVTKGIGESCGSVFLDINYLNLLEEKLGSEQLSRVTLREMSDLMDQFIDTIKPEFDGLDDHYVTLPRSVERPPSADDDYLDEGTLKLGAEELKTKVFDPVVDQVLSLVEEQYKLLPDERLTYIYLVGGFGSSNYLYQRIQSQFASRVSQIVCPADRSALAVVRGAVLYALNPRVITSRVSRRTYGINAGLPFDAALDPPSSRVVRPDGSVRCTTRFLVFVKKNDVLPIDHCIQEEMFVYYGLLKRTDIMLYATEADEVPRYYNDPNVHHVAAISVPIPVMPGVAHGERISYIVRMYFGMTEIRMEADFGTGETYNVHCDFDAISNYDDPTDL